MMSVAVGDISCLFRIPDFLEIHEQCEVNKLTISLLCIITPFRLIPFSDSLI